MTPHYEQIIRRLNMTLTAHYSLLADDLSHSAANEPQRLTALVNIRVSHLRDSDVIADFSDLVERYFPSLLPVSVLEETP